MQVIIFDLQGQQYAIKTEKVEEISRLLDVTPIPNAPHHIKGLINLRGNVISLMELSKLLSLQMQEEQEYTNIIIANIDSEMIGLLVGDVWEVMNIDEELIERVELGEEEQRGIKGIIQVQDRIINFLDLEECIAI